MSSQPGWYPDPSGSTGTLRYWDGARWTPHFVAVASHAWKGEAYGRPASGSGSLAEPWRRLVAQLLDALIVLPIAATIFFGVLFGGLSATSFAFDRTGTAGSPLLAGAVTSFALGAIAVSLLGPLYQGTTTGLWGRSPGKMLMSIRPVTRQGDRLDWPRSFARAFAYWAMGLVSVLWFIDVLFCTWDDNAECLHDKWCKTLVVAD